MKIVIDQGHGYGVAHNRGGVLFNEGDQNFKFGMLLRAELLKYQNVQVVMTRYSIYEDPSLAQRAYIGIGADLYVSTHTNAGSSDATGIEIFRSKFNTYRGNQLINNLCAVGSKTMNIVNRGQKYWDWNGGDYWGVFNWGNNATDKMLIEWCFHTNYYDSKQYLANQANLAILAAAEIARSYGLKKKITIEKTEVKKVEKNYVYTLEVGLFTDKENAEIFMQSLTKRGIRGFQLKKREFVVSPSEPEHGFVGTYRSTLSKQAIRKEASDKSEVIGYLYKGHTRDIAYIKGAWAKLKYAQGFVAAKFLEKVEK